MTRACVVSLTERGAVGTVCTGSERWEHHTWTGRPTAGGGARHAQAGPRGSTRERRPCHRGSRHHVARRRADAGRELHAGREAGHRQGAAGGREGRPRGTHQRAGERRRARRGAGGDLLGRQAWPRGSDRGARLYRRGPFRGLDSGAGLHGDEPAGQGLVAPRDHPTAQAARRPLCRRRRHGRLCRSTRRALQRLSGRLVGRHAAGAGLRVRDAGRPARRGAVADHAARHARPAGAVAGAPLRRRPGTALPGVEL